MARNNDETVLKEIIRGEKAKVNEYKDVVRNNTLAPQINSMLQSQLKDIKSTLIQVRSLERIA